MRPILCVQNSLYVVQQACLWGRRYFDDIYFNLIYLEYDMTKLEKDKKIYPGESEMIKKSIDMLVELIIGVCREWSWGNVLKNTNVAPFL